jgi:hypothetical protein
MSQLAPMDRHQCSLKGSERLVTLRFPSFPKRALARGLALAEFGFREAHFIADLLRWLFLQVEADKELPIARRDALKHFAGDILIFPFNGSLHHGKEGIGTRSSRSCGPNCLQK